MTTVTINGNTYSDDGTETKDMLNGGHRAHFFPLVQDVVTTASGVSTDASTASTAATTAQTAIASYEATSTTSLSVAAGTKSFTIQADKLFVAGGYVTISRTSAPTTVMAGVITSYDDSTGAMVVEVSDIAGSGTYTDWTIALSGAIGEQGPSGDGVMPYLAKSSAYTITAADRGALVDATAAITLSFQPAATLGADWSAYVRNTSSGAVTLDPDGSETIDGESTVILYPGQFVIVQCDGSELRTQTDGPGRVLLSVAEASSDAAIDFTLDGRFSRYEVDVIAVVPATDRAELQMRSSGDGGSTFDSTSGDYQYSTISAGASTAGVGGGGSKTETVLRLFSSRNISNTASHGGLSGKITVLSPSTPDYTNFLSHAVSVDSADSVTLNQVFGTGARASITVVDAIRFLFDSGNIASGTFKLYGVV